MKILIKTTSKAFFFIAIFSFFAKCNVPQITKEAPGLNLVKKGSKFQIILPEDHRTGYLWQLSAGFDEKLIKNSNTVWHGNEKGVYFTFETLQKGQAVLKFVNRKYTDTSNVKSFIITILE